MYKSESELIAGFYTPLVEVWMERLREAEVSKARFNKIGQVCNDFYVSQAGFMWDQKEFFNGSLPKPKFAFTIAKAFEFVSIYGPSLFWDYADRKVTGQRQIKIEPEMFGDVNDPNVMKMAEEVMRNEAMEESLHRFGRSMMGTYLNWSQREQPGGMVLHGQMAITESLIKGMGLLWPQTYQFPGSQSTYTRLCYGSVEDLYIDPDCNDPLWETAGYIVRKHVEPTWEVERKFKLARNSLASFATSASAELRARKTASNSTKKETFDCITWYEIWSKVGIGPRTDKLNHHMVDMFDQQLGDFAYLCISPTVPYPLNAPPDKFFGDDPAGSPEVLQMFEWRCSGYGDIFPCYKDRRWPVSPVWYNPIMGSAWPLAPLAPGLGELVALNVLTSAYVESAWENRKQILAYVKSAASELEGILQADEAFAKIPLNDNIHRNINEVMQFLNRPNSNSDILTAIGMMAQQFNDRVGLSELHYGQSATQIRVAADARQKQEAVSVRPEKMSGDVARWFSDASQLEMILAALHVKGAHLTHLLGGFGASQWDQYFGEMPVEQLMRECKASVEASEVRRPNKERDTANIQTLQQFLLPTLTKFAETTGDTQPFNKFMEMIGDAMELEGDPIELPPWQPPVDPQQAEIQKQVQQLEMGKTAAETQHKEASASKAIADAVAKMHEVQQPAGGLINELKHEQEIRHKEDTHAQNMIQSDQEFIQGLLFADMQNEQDLEAKEELMEASEKGSKADD